jgi:hypothetical protein
MGLFACHVITSPAGFAGVTRQSDNGMCPGSLYKDPSLYCPEMEAAPFRGLEAMNRHGFLGPPSMSEAG